MSGRCTQLAGQRLLVLGTWDMRDKALASWADAGIEVTLVDRSASSRPGPAARRIDIDVWDSAAPGLASLRELASGADGVVTLAEFCTVTAARVAQDAGLPGPGLGPARHARDKVALRERLAAVGLAGPRFATVCTDRDVAEFFRAGACDAVLKPADSAGSTAVARVSTPAEAIEALPGVLRWSFSGRAILEEFIVGPEFSVEVVVQHGVASVAAIVEKTTMQPGFVEVRHVIPGNIPGSQSAALADAAANVIGALEVQDAIVHAEFRLGPDGFVPIEIAVRPAGGLIPDLVALATGFDLYRAQAALAVGRTPEPVDVPNAGCAGVQFVTATGTVQHDAPIEELLHDHPQLDRAGQLVPSGTVIDELDTNGVRAGYVMARADTRDALTELLAAASVDLAGRMGLTRSPAQPPVPARSGEAGR